MAYPRGEVAPYAGRNIKHPDINVGADYVKDGKVYNSGSNTSVMVTAQSDLANLEGYLPGTVAYTAGFANVWQLAANGTWVSL